jgi:Na+-transporting NADH:ubiquinone oxidoreductase subunit B
MQKKVRRHIDKIKPHFQPGGRFAKLQAAFEAIEDFLYVPAKVTEQGTHIRDNIDLKRTMTALMIAVLPATLFGIWNTGYQHYLATGEAASFWENIWFGLGKFLPLVIVSYASGLLVEIIFNQVRRHPVSEGFFVTGLLIPLIMPVDVPLWMLAVATAFAVLFGKEVFGGTGMNIWNVALLTRAVLFFAYPSFMSGDKVWISGMIKDNGIIDGFSGATPLAQAAAGAGTTTNGLGEPYSFMDMFVGIIPGSVGETSTLAILIGLAFLLFIKMISWRIVLSVCLGGLTMGVLLNIFAVNPFMAIPAHHHLVMGGFAFGAVFMATDPVTASQTLRGKWIFGFLVGFLAILIRVLNPAYPEGVMMAILLMNTFAPLIDHYVIKAHINKRLRRSKITKTGNK